MPLNFSFEIDTQDYLVENGGIVLLTQMRQQVFINLSIKIEEIVKVNQSVVVIIDEAYINFGGRLPYLS